MNKTRGTYRFPATVPSTSKNRTALPVPRQRTAPTGRPGRPVLENTACPTPRHPAGREPSGSVCQACLAGAFRRYGTTA